MKKLIVPASAAALLALASVASAANVTGTIKSIDAAKGTVELNNGSVYSAPSKIKLSQFKVGEKVSVNYEKTKGKMELSTLSPAT